MKNNFVTQDVLVQLANDLVKKSGMTYDKVGEALGMTATHRRKSIQLAITRNKFIPVTINIIELFSELRFTRDSRGKAISTRVYFVQNTDVLPDIESDESADKAE